MGHLSEQRYSHYVSTLKEKVAGFAISPSRRPRGLAWIEVHGKAGRISLRVKNLKTPTVRDRKVFYEVWLESSQGHKFRPARIGTLEVDGRGDGVASLDFAADDVEGTGLSLEELDRISIVAGIDSKGKCRKKVALTGDLELEVAESYDGLNMEKVNPFGQSMPNHRWWKFYPNHFLAGAGTGTKQENEDEPVTDFQSQAQKLLPEEVQAGPVFRGHQLIGLYYDEKGAVSCLVHGIPGRFCVEDQPDGGTSGYVYWQPLPGQSYQKGHYGYWLVHIDPESGEVVYPREKVVLPE